MNNQKLYLLILEDNPDDAELMVNELQKNDFDFKWERVETKKEFVNALKNKPDIILADYKMPTFNGMSAIKILQKTAPEIPLIIVSGTIGEELAVECLKAGATDYVLKDRLFRLPHMLKRILKEVDIFKTKEKVENDLQESEERFKYLVKNSNDMIVIIDKDGKEIYVSDSVERITGYTPNEKIGHSGFEFLHPDDVEHVSKTLSKLLKNPGEIIREEYRHKHKNGGWINLEAIGVNYIDEPSVLGTVLNIRDITNRKLAEKKLLESEKKYQAFFDATGTATIIIDEDSTIIYANKECKSVTGYPISELINQSWTKFVYKDDLPLMLIRHKERRKDPNSVPNKYEARLINAKGEIRNIILSIGMIPDTNKSTVSMLDITERIKAEKILQENEDKYKTLFDVAHDAIIVADVESGIIVDANKKALELTGYSIDELIGKHQTFLHPKNKKEENISIFKNSVANKGSVVSKVEVVHKNETIIPVEISSGGEIQISGKAIHIGVFRDVSIRKKAEEALNQSEEKYRNLVENIEEGIASVDENDNFSFVNTAASKIFGYSKEELLKMNFKDLLTPENQQNFLQQTDLRKKGEIGKYDIVFNRKDGDIRVISSSVSPLFTNDEFKGSFGIFYDITERKKAEEQIKKSNEELAAFNKLAIGRELRMIELKSEINELLKKIGKEEKYKINE